MTIAVISGSARPNSQSVRVAAWIERQLSDRHEVSVLDLSQTFVPEDASALFDKHSDESAHFLPTRQLLEAVDAVVVVSPEWGGMPPGKLVTFFQCIGDSLAHKPALMVTDSATRFGGAFPSEIIRGHAGKNTRIVWLPEYIIIRSVEQKFQEEPDADDSYIQARLRKALELLVDYGQTLAPVRPRLIDVLKDYPNGM